MLKTLKFANLIILSFTLTLSSCTDFLGLLSGLENSNTVNTSSNSKPQSSPSPSLVDNDSHVKTANILMSPLGGKLTVSDPKSLINGLVIEVPEKSYSDYRTFEVSYTSLNESIINNKNIKVISPLIKIKNGGGYSKELMTVKIPIKKSSDEFAIPIVYNEKTGEFEILPVLEEDNQLITFTSRHFSHSEMNFNNKMSLKGINDAWSSIFISTIKESELLKSSVISTGFKVGIDNWEFINRGSVTNTSGICAGMGVSSLWYYYEKKLNGFPSLNGLFDNQDSLWQDNRKGYRFASVAQTIYEESDLLLQNMFYRLSKVSGDLQWKLFISSMLITGEPQMVGVLRNGGGHALIVYKIDISNGKLYVIDPNFESEFNQERFIQFENGNFKPYISSEKAGDPGREYDLVLYNSKSSYLDWYKLGEKWKEVENNTIGDDIFPPVEFRLYLNSNDTVNYKVLTDDFISSKKEILVESYMNNKNGKSGWTPIRVYNGISEFPSIRNDSYSKVELQPGNNLLGFWSYMGTKENPDWVDFRYYNIKLQELLINPSILTGEINEEYSWKPESALPPNTVYEWTFGDGEDQSSIGNKSVYHKYEFPGNFTINLKAKDPSNNSLIGEASAIANISAPSNDLKIENLNKLSVSFQAVNSTLPFLYNQDGTESSFKAFYGVNYKGDVISPLIWNSNTFSVTFDDTNSSAERLGMKIIRNMSGTLDFVNKKLIELKSSTITSQDGVIQTETGFIVKNVPLSYSEEIYGTVLKFDYDGFEQDLSNYITPSSINLYGKEPSSINWSNSRLQIIFQ